MTYAETSYSVGIAGKFQYEEMSFIAANLSIEDFKREVKRQMDEARNDGAEYVDIVSGDVHRELGGYPGPGHSMPSCCKAMYDYKKPNDIIMEAPPKGKGASLKIRYYI